MSWQLLPSDNVRGTRVLRTDSARVPVLLLIIVVDFALVWVNMGWYGLNVLDWTPSTPMKDIERH